MEIAVYMTRGQMVQTSGTAGYHKPGSHVSMYLSTASSQQMLSRTVLLCHNLLAPP